MHVKRISKSIAPVLWKQEHLTWQTCRPIPVIESENSYDVSLNCPAAEGDMRWNLRTWESACPGNTVELIQDPVVVQMWPLWEAVLEELDRDGAAEAQGGQENRDIGDVDVVGRKRQHSQPRVARCIREGQAHKKWLIFSGWRLDTFCADLRGTP